MKWVNISSLLVLAGIIIILAAGLTDRDPNGDSNAFWCDCYKTIPFTTDDFVSNEAQILKVNTACEEGYFITGFVQAPIKDPAFFGQVVFIEQMNCCKPCTK